MKINRIINDQGQFRCFEVSNEIISRSGMAKVISNIDGVLITQHPKFYDYEVFCEFRLKDCLFTVSEPYGDSGIYDVSTSENGTTELNLIAKHFEEAEAIKGGDFGRKAFFIFEWIFSSIVLLSIFSFMFDAAKSLF